MGPRSWLLSPQLTLQLSCSLVISSLFTLWSPIHFSNACLVPVFVAVIVGSLSMDQHVGTRLQVSAWILGPTWVAAGLAGALMTLSKLAGFGHPQHSVDAGYVAATVVLGLLGLALLVFLQAVSPPGPVKIMGVIAILMYGIMVILSTLYPDLSTMWVKGMLSIVLGAMVAAGVGILVGFLVLPSLATDEVWRLTSEALQGAGSVLSYHTSLLMVDEPTVLGPSSYSDSTAHKAVPAASKLDSGRDDATARAADRRDGRRWRRQQQQHQQHAELRQHHRMHSHQEQASHQHHQTRHADSSIEIAAASAAVVAASEDARHHAAEAAAATAAFSWVDESDAAVSVALGTIESNAPAGPNSGGSTRSRHSSAESNISLVGSDAIADAAAEYSKRFLAQHPQDQQDEDAAGKPKLCEELLQQFAEQQPAVVALPKSGSRVDAWVSAVAATAAAATGLMSRRGSLTEPGIRRRISEDGSISGSFTSNVGVGSGVLQERAGRRSLDGAASLYFTEEVDDTTFIQMMRVLSLSKSSTKPPAAADAVAKLTGSLAQQPAAAAAPAGVAGGGVASGRKGLPHSKSAGSALSALSVAGSSTAPEDWTHAVSPKHGHAGTSSSIVLDSQDVVPEDVGPAQVSKPLSVFSFGSTRIKPAAAKADSTPQQRQLSRLGASLATDKQQPRGSISTRQSIGLRAWSFLTQSSFAAPQAPAGPGPLGSSQQSPAAVKQASPHHQQDPKQQPPAGDTQQLHDIEVDARIASVLPLLPPPTSSAQLQPLIGRAKAVLASARIEPWWLRPKGSQHFDADACMKLLDDIELLLVRLSTLEGVSEERSLMGLHLHELAHYKSIADALALIFAQLTAFMVHVSMALAAWETGHGGSAASGKVHGSHNKGPGKPQGQHASSGSPAQAAYNRHLQAAGSSLKPQAPFAQVNKAEVGAGADGDAASIGISTLLSGMERQGSVVSSYLWQQHKTGWTQAREMLRRELDASLGSYWWSVRKASKQLPVKVPRSREVMILMFLWPICNGVLEACERIEASAQQVLKPVPATHHHSSSSGSKDTAAAHQHHSSSSKAGEHHGAYARAQAAVVAWWHSLLRFVHWAGPLLLLVLMQGGWLAGYRAVTTSVPATLSSKQRVQQMLSSRAFQASFKLLLTTGFVLVATILLMVCIPAVAHSVPIFGYATVVLCFQPRVEATVDSATRRVLGTILGASLGLAINSIPGIFEMPFVMLACLAVASVPLGVLATPQRRTAIVLAVITLAAVSLCGYQATCCTPAGGMSPIDTFIARLASVCGACIFVALFNRVVMPWYTSDYALEQLADALEEATRLFGRVYMSQLERMRLSELVADQVKQEGPEALQDHLSAALPAAAASAGCFQEPASQGGAGDPASLAQCISTAGGAAAQVSPAVALAACEAAEAQLLVVLRQQVLSRLVAVQLSLATESVSWRRGVLATPPLVLNVLGALNAVKEALTSQRLALAPFTRVGAASLNAEQPAGAVGSGSGMLHMMEHCYSMWALPLHPLWLEIMHTVQELTAATAGLLRRQPHGTAARAAAKAQLTALLEQLESKRLDLRHAWLDIRVQLHRAVHANQPRDGSGRPLWPTDSLHLFTQTYGVSRCLNAFAAAAQAVASSLDD